MSFRRIHQGQGPYVCGAFFVRYILTLGCEVNTDSYLNSFGQFEVTPLIGIQKYFYIPICNPKV